MEWEMEHSKNANFLQIDIQVYVILIKVPANCFVYLGNVIL